MGASGDRKAAHMLRITLYDRNDLVGKASAEALIELLYGPPGADSFAAALRDSEARVRYYAIRKLEELQAVDRLIEATYNDDSVVRRIAIWYLGRVYVPDAIQAMVDALRDSDMEVRGGAVYALGNLGDARAVHVLLPLLDDPDSAVASLTDDALYKLGYASAV
jgi:HEAT repeat protein